MGCAGGAHPNLKDTHQGTSALPALLSSPARGAGSPLGLGQSCASTSPFWASWAPAADVHTCDAIPAFRNTDTESRRQPDISTLLLAARDCCPA